MDSNDEESKNLNDDESSNFPLDYPISQFIIKNLNLK